EIEAGVGRDGVEPRAQRGSTLEDLTPAPGAEERLLHDVLGIAERAEHPIRVQVQLAPVACGDRGECRLVALANRVDDGFGCFEWIHRHGHMTAGEHETHRSVRKPLVLRLGAVHAEGTTRAASAAPLSLAGPAGGASTPRLTTRWIVSSSSCC